MFESQLLVDNLVRLNIKKKTRLILITQSATQNITKLTLSHALTSTCELLR